jgi:hypothetical protein
MKTRGKLHFTSLLILLALALSLGVEFAFAQSNPAATLQTANDEINGAFNAVLSAEKSGANTTNLADRLNVGTDLLAQAEIAFRKGDSNTAVSKANDAISVAGEVKSSAQSAQTAANSSKQNAFLITIGGSVAGCVVLVLALFIVWRRIKKKYVRDFGAARPEVTPQ